MGSLRSVDSSTGVDFYDLRDTLYYKKYKYKVKFELYGANRLWGCTSPDLASVRLTLQLQHISKASDRKLLIANIESLCNFVSWREQNTDNTVIRIEGRGVSIFADDLSLLKTITKIDKHCKIDFKFIEARPVDGPTEIKYFINEPKHKFRLYFKTTYVKRDIFMDFATFLNANPEKIFPSSALHAWYRFISSKTRSGFYLSSKYYIDYDDDSNTSYLMLMFGELFGKRCKLEKRPDQC